MITKLTKHDNHTVKIYQTQNTSQHSYSLRCCDCDKHIQWLGTDDAKELLGMGFELADKKYIVPEYTLPRTPWGYLSKGEYL